MNDLVDRVAILFGLTRADLISSSRRRYIVEARQAAAWALRTAYPQLSLEMIGARLGRRDHTTISYALQRVEERMRADADYAAMLHALLPARASAPPDGADRRMRRAVRRVGEAWWAGQGMPRMPLAA